MSTLQNQNKALLIIDIQNDYFISGSMPLVNAEEASLNAKLMLAHFREKQFPVIHIKHIADRPNATFFIPDTWGSVINSNVLPRDDEKIIIKYFPNSFYETELLSYLHEKQITDLVICGMMTHMCIDSTARAAKDHGFNLELISDACATKDLEINDETISANDVQSSFLAALNYYYANILTTDQFIRDSLGY